MSVTATPARRLVSIAATAEILGISPRTVRRLIAAGELEAIRVGRRTIRIKIESIDLLMDAHPLNSWVRPEPSSMSR